MPSSAELLNKVKSTIREADPSEVREHIGNGTVLVDVRESDEVAAGKIPGAVHVPRGYLESRIEGNVADRDQHLVLYCASGNRSAYAARTLQEDLGYTNVESLKGGITLWKDRGYPVEVPRSLTPEQRDRYSRHLLLPEVGEEGQTKLLDAKVLLLGAGGLGSPPPPYPPAGGAGPPRPPLPRGGRRRHPRPRGRRRRRPLEPAAPGHPYLRPRRHPEGRLRRGDH